MPTEQNFDPPTGNDFVRSQRIAGDVSKRSTFWGILDAGDGTSYVYGFEDGVAALSRTDASGAPLWTRDPGYWVYGACVVSTPSMPAAAVTVGSGDGWGRITLWNGADGTRLQEIGPHSRLYFRDVAVAGTQADGTELVVVGYARPTSSPRHPIVQRVSLASDGSFVRGEMREYTDHPMYRLRNVACEPGRSPAVAYAAGNFYAGDSAAVKAVVYAFSDSLSVDWRTELVATPGLETEGRGIRWMDGRLIVVGRTHVVKENPPADGCCWSAGLVASLSPQGQVQWLHTVNASRTGDWLRDCVVAGSYVYAVGDCAGFTVVTTRRTFGYGLLAKIDAATGTLVSSLRIGAPDYNSGFNGLVVRGDRAWCAGYTSQRTDPGGSQSWLAEIDLARMPALVTDAAPVAQHDSRIGTVPHHRESLAMEVPEP